MRCVLDISCRENRHTHYTFHNFFPKIVPLRENVEKYCKAEQATYDDILRRMRISCWIIKATVTQPDYVCLLLFHGNDGDANARQCDVTCTLSILFYAFLI